MKNRSCIKQFIGDINSEVEYLFEKGTPFDERRGSRKNAPNTRRRRRHLRDEVITARQRTETTIGDINESSRVHESGVRDETGDGSSDTLSRVIETISQCFYQWCFSNPIFNSQAFISDCHGLLQDNEDQTDSKTKSRRKNHNGRFKENIFTIILDKTTDGRSQSCG